MSVRGRCGDTFDGATCIRPSGHYGTHYCAAPQKVWETTDALGKDQVRQWTAKKWQCRGLLSVDR